ncbi:MAG: hypothetical protein GKR91_06245 [Pseudomonadales bacterium]|nr:hypothetical protein [Pseudomonadales bacterium]
MTQDKLFKIVQISNHEALNLSLRTTLLNKSATEPDAVSHLSHGQSAFHNKWLSKIDLHKSSDPDLKSLAATIEKTANRLISNSGIEGNLSMKHMWSMVSQPGFHGDRHNHAAHLSGAYYVDVGSSGVESGGILQLYQSKDDEQPAYEVMPENGMMVLFPGALDHQVSVYNGEAPRVTISFNLVMDSKN